MASVAAEWGYFDVALILETAFRPFLRTTEFLDLRKCNVSFGAGGLIHLSLEDSKGANRSGNLEAVSFRSSPLQAKLRRYLKNLQPGDRVLQRSPAEFRALFQALVVALHLEDLGLKPYSLRRGGLLTFSVSPAPWTKRWNWDAGGASAQLVST